MNFFIYFIIICLIYEGLLVVIKSEWVYKLTGIKTLIAPSGENNLTREANILIVLDMALFSLLIALYGIFKVNIIDIFYMSFISNTRMLIPETNDLFNFHISLIGLGLTTLCTNLICLGGMFLRPHVFNDDQKYVELDNEYNQEHDYKEFTRNYCDYMGKEALMYLLGTILFGMTFLGLAAAFPLKWVWVLIIIYLLISFTFIFPDKIEKLGIAASGWCMFSLMIPFFIMLFGGTSLGILTG
ncbi:hypothetical protein [Methanosphaera sp.]